MSPPDLRLGDWRDVLSDVECDAMITDPPFSSRTETGFRGHGTHGEFHHGISYGSIDAADATALALWAKDRVRWWAVVFSDHVLQPAWESAFASVGWYVFAPVAWVKNDGPPRFTGDGPASSLEWITVARPRHRIPPSRSGSRPGWYKGNISKEGKANAGVIVGRKPLSLMEAIVRDYTLPGDIVVDPYGGSGTTLHAASALGRRAVGAEIDPDTHAKATARLSGGFQGDLFAGGA